MQRLEKHRPNAVREIVTRQNINTHTPIFIQSNTHAYTKHIYMLYSQTYIDKDYRLAAKNEWSNAVAPQHACVCVRVRVLLCANVCGDEMCVPN